MTLNLMHIKESVKIANLLQPHKKHSSRNLTNPSVMESQGQELHAKINQIIRSLFQI